LSKRHCATAFVATPERSDGGDLLALCQQNLVYRCDLVDGVRKDLLAPFHHFGVPDDVDCTNTESAMLISASDDAMVSGC
jgi:superfamily II DNA or RNA helicase